MAGLLGLDKLFEGRYFDRSIIVMCVMWYLRFKLSYRDLVEMMAERGLPMAHATIMRRAHLYTPEFERRWNRFARPVGASWRVDETYVKVRGKVGLFDPSGGSRRAYSGLSAQRQTRCRYGQGVLPQGHQASGLDASDDWPGR